MREVEWVEQCDGVPAFAANKPRPQKEAYKRGLKYEGRVKEWLTGRFGERFIPGPWFRFKAPGDRKIKYCQPDGLIYGEDGRQVTVVEIKLTHCELAWFQLFNLYLPVLKAVDSGVDYLPLEITTTFDCMVRMPGSCDLVEDVFDRPQGQLGVLVWRP